MTKQIITSLLDNDLYKFTMMQAVLHQYPAADVTYQFKCRNRAKLSPYVDELKVAISALCQLRLSEQELDYLASLNYIKNDFIAFLRLFHLDERFINLSAKGDDLELTVEGPWLHTILFEVPLLAIINEVYFRNCVNEPDWTQGEKRLQEKIALINDYPFKESYRLTEFGTRRRFCATWQRQVVTQLKDGINDYFPGTSNILLAKELDLTPFGTMAHEYLQAHQALGPRLIDSQKAALESWVQEYRGDLGIALSDVVGMEAFLNDFDCYFSKLFDGMRHDSGDPFVWGEKAINHYQALGIDPRTKWLIFSDALTIEKSLAIHKTFHQQAKLAFGIGTHLTNDLGYEPLQIVIKMTHCNGQPVAKISDSQEKLTCDDNDYLQYLKKVFHIN